MTSAYQQLEKTFNQIGLFSDINGMLFWDTASMMPAGASNNRAEQSALISRLQHEMLANPKTADAISTAEQATDLDAWQQRNVQLIRHQYNKASALDPSLVENLSRIKSKCELLWRNARAESDFSLIKPALGECLELTIEMGKAYANQMNCSVHEALIDDFDPGRKTDEIDNIFSQLEAFLPGFVKQVTEQQASRPAPLTIEGPFPVEKQKELGRRLMQTLGFDFERGRIDTSTHPFCGGSTNDVRITARYDENDFSSGLMAVLHETGHALYEQGKPEAWLHQPVGQAIGMTIHESQSLLTEMQACRSLEFITHMAPIAQEVFGRTGPEWSAENLYRHSTTVKPSFIRVDADELTYPLHVIMRYKLEKQLLTGDLLLDDLPEAWNSAMQNYLGIIPANDAEGCLQDIHWPVGLFGYFPAYTLGAMTAAQLFQSAKQATPDLGTHIQAGNFKPLLNWLRDNVHSQGSRYTPNELLTKATGSTIDVELYKRHLQERYAD